MAIATCVLTCRSWFSMSSTSCFANFSGSSAFSIRSLMLARKRVPTRSSSAMVNLLSERNAGGWSELACDLPTTTDDAVESDEHQDGQKAAGKTVPPVATSVAVVSVGAEVGATDTVGIPERPEDEAEDNGDCDEDEDGRDDDEGEHRIFSIRAFELEKPTRAHQGRRSPVSLGGYG